MNKTIIAIAIFVVSLFSVGLVNASETDGTVATGGNSGYAWSNRAGWINFGISTGNIHIRDSGITGNAWSNNYGWINMSPTNGGVLVAASGALSGHAWGAGLGWINFSGVSINSSGKFVGQATGDLVGTLTFGCDNCSVITDYRPQNFRSVSPSSGSGGGGGLPPGYSNPPISPAGGFSIIINNNDPTTQSRSVTLSIRGGPDTVRMAISNFPDFRDAGQEAYQAARAWTLLDNVGINTVYAKFYTQYGYSSETVSDIIVYTTVSPPDSNTTQIVPPVLAQAPPSNIFQVPRIPSNITEIPEELGLEIPAALFDIRLQIDDDSVPRAEDLVARITFESFGRLPTPVEMTFSILDSSRAEVWKSVDSITVETEEVFEKRFTGLSLKDGSYTLRLRTFYGDDVEDFFESPFSIEELQKRSSWIIWAISLISALIAVLIFWLIVLKRKRKDDDVTIGNQDENGQQI